ncbi:hypothetical protein Taro_022750 [Colocasia esculenta]|uniref:Uncharacterized protein n=1 Tax=Colocasia esculenta TaxID=4460 RepID=A0A843UVA9_COLES|nr:hypothetical protein [Colocasia esculenta]
MGGPRLSPLIAAGNSTDDVSGLHNRRFSPQLYDVEPVESAVLSGGKPANAWEEGDEVILITCRLENPDLDLINGIVHGKLQTFKNELYMILIPGKIVKNYGEVDQLSSVALSEDYNVNVLAAALRGKAKC